MHVIAALWSFIARLQSMRMLFLADMKCLSSPKLPATIQGRERSNINPHSVDTVLGSTTKAKMNVHAVCRTKMHTCIIVAVFSLYCTIIIFMQVIHDCIYVDYLRNTYMCMCDKFRRHLSTGRTVNVFTDGPL